MFTVYVIKSLSRDYKYVGFTNDLSRRLFDHNNGYNKSTKLYAPFELIYTKSFSSRTDARKHEKFLKSTHGRKFLAKFLNSKDVSSQTDKKD